MTTSSHNVMFIGSRTM